MSHTYSRQEALAQRLIRDKGTTCLLVRRGASTGDAFNPTAGADTTETLRAVLLDCRSSEIDGTLIRSADRKALASTEGVTAAPTVSDKLRIGTVDYEIVSVKTLPPADTAVMWTLQVRI